MIYVLGSINNDISLELERMPKRGETLIADSCVMGLGGKGANQAVAIAKLAMKRGDNRPAVKMIGLVGNDSMGNELIRKLEEHGVDTEFVRRVKRNTGMAIVNVVGKDNRIVVYSGANMGLSKSDVDEALAGATSKDMLICQLEIPLYIVGYAMRKAQMIGMTTVLNPAPAKHIPDDFYYSTNMIVPNEVETRMLTGINPKTFEDQKAAIKAFHERGVQYVVLTLGGGGVTLSDNERPVAHIPAHKVNVVDTTAAGDTFVGALALTYPHIGMYSFREACLFATRAAALAVSRRGASESIPTFDEVCELYNREL